MPNQIFGDLFKDEDLRLKLKLHGGGRWDKMIKFLFYLSVAASLMNINIFMDNRDFRRYYEYDGYALMAIDAKYHVKEGKLAKNYSLQTSIFQLTALSKQ